MPAELFGELRYQTAPLGLVAHGPPPALLMLELARRNAPERRVRREEQHATAEVTFADP